MSNVVDALKKLASTDIFKDTRSRESFVGRPFYFDYNRMKILVNDKWKNAVGGIPAGAFLLCSYEGKADDEELILVRVIGPTTLPTDSHVIASMVDYYKEGIETGVNHTKLDSYTRYEFMFSGIECRVLGTFYRDTSDKIRFGADIDNFFSPHNYSVFKATAKVLEYIANFNEGEGIPGGENQVRFGEVRYSSTQKKIVREQSVPVYVSALDFVGKRTALFGMTRTGKSNTVKKLIECIEELNSKGISVSGDRLDPIGQIIFDVNGEYANPNQQDEGTAIFELFRDKTTRYSLENKDGFKVMKVNFHREIEEGFGLLSSFLGMENQADYIRSFLSIDLEKPDQNDFGKKTRWERLVAAYQACLYAAGFSSTDKVKFSGSKETNEIAGGIDPSNGITLEKAIQWFSAVWDSYEDIPKKNGTEWANEDLKAALVMLTRKRQPGKAASISGFRKLKPFVSYHSAQNDTSFEADIINHLRKGNIVIIDLSQGNPTIQKTYSERICRRIFNNSMRNFIDNKSQNFIQLFFEEAHNLFPKKDDKDLSQIYNRIAKEGAKARLGLIYATQEVSSISANVLKNTQNWFVSHLNNKDELREIEKFYDYEDFVDSWNCPVFVDASLKLLSPPLSISRNPLDS